MIEPVKHRTYAAPSDGQTVGTSDALWRILPKSHDADPVRTGRIHSGCTGCRSLLGVLSALGWCGDILSAKRAFPTHTPHVFSLFAISAPSIAKKFGRVVGTIAVYGRVEVMYTLR